MTVLTARAGVVAGTGLLLLLASGAGAQTFAYRGFLETRVVAYPQSPSDGGSADEGSGSSRAQVEARARFEPGYRPTPWLSLSASIEARIDSADQVDSAWTIDWRDRGALRPSLSIRQLSTSLRRGRVIAEAGRQFIRWGKTDILNPTDRFAPQDFLEVTEGDFLAVTGLRVQYESGPNSFDAAWVPEFTPSRIPPLGSRWAPLPSSPGLLPVVDGGARYPDGSQIGGRWNHLGALYEFSFSLYDGFSHLPLLEARARPFPPALELIRSYPALRMVGADAVVPLPWFALKGEAAYLATKSAEADDIVLYVIQAERQSGELSLVGGYAGELVTANRTAIDFAPDRGLTEAFLARVGYTIDANRSVAVEAAARQTGDAVWTRVEYSHASARGLRVIAAGTLIRGKRDDFLGQYRRNSHLTVTVRYSF